MYIRITFDSSMQLAFEPGDDFGVRLWRRFPTLRGVGLGVLLFLGFFALWFSAAFGVWTLSADFSGLGLLLRSVCGVLVRGLFEASVGFSGLGLLLRSVSGVLAGFSGLGLLLWSVSGVLVAGFSGLGLLRSGVGVAVRFEASAGFSGLGTLLRSVLGTVGFFWTWHFAAVCRGYCRLFWTWPLSAVCLGGLGLRLFWSWHTVCLLGLGSCCRVAGLLFWGLGFRFCGHGLFRTGLRGLACQACCCWGLAAGAF